MAIFRYFVQLLLVLLVSTGGVFAQYNITIPPAIKPQEITRDTGATIGAETAKAPKQERIAPSREMAGQSEQSIPASTNYAIDQTNTFSATELASLNAKLKAFDEETGSQIFVLMIPTVQPETIETYAVRVFEAWKVGRKGIDDGVLYVIAKNDRRQRLEVGYGLEGAIPDILASRILNDTVAPYFKQNQYVTGIDKGVTQLMSLIKNENLPSKTSGVEADTFDGSDVVTVLIVLGIACLIAIFVHPVFGAVVSAQLMLGFVESVGLAIGLAIAVFLISSFLRLFFKNNISTARNQSARQTRTRSRNDTWGGFGGGGFGGGGFGGGGFGGGFGGGGGGSSGGGGASGGW